MTKQTGPAEAVKGLRAKGLRWPLAAVFGVVLLSGCATTWTNSDKTAAEVEADKNACAKIGEEDALERTGHARADYGMPPGGPTPGGAGSAGLSPMQMHDRDVAVRDYDSSYDDCMESKGYRKSKSGM